jgi:hypothetical protein
MGVVDSKEKILPPAAVITMALENVGTGDMPVETAMMTIVKETETADVVQIGNTVFIGHFGAGANKDKVVGRPLNADIGRNYVRNILKYAGYLQKRGITDYVTQFEGDVMLPAMRALKKVFDKTDSVFQLEPAEDNHHVLFVKLGEEPLDKGL